MKKLIFSLAALLITSGLAAQSADSVSWERKGSLGFNFANVGLSNWAGGGENSISLGAVYNTAFIRTTANNSWKTSIDFALGGAKVGEGEFRKTDDQIILNSQYTKSINEHWGWGFGGMLRTQLLVGNVFSVDPADATQEVATKISNFMAPGYLTINLGFDYNPSKAFSVSMAPAAGKFTFVLDDELFADDANPNEVVYGVEEGNQVRAEFGANILATLNVDVAENISFQSSLNFFTAYDTFGNVDTNWETLLVMKVNEWFNATLGTQLIYDDDIKIDAGDGSVPERAIQFKHVLNIGVNFSLFK